MAASDEHVLDGRPLSSLRVVDLKEELEARGLSKSGAKKDLLQRLKTYLDQQPPRSIPLAAANPSESESPSKISPKEAEVPPALTSPSRVSAADLPPMKIDAQLSDNDFVKDYLALRQSQFQSATANAALTTQAETDAAASPRSAAPAESFSSSPAIPVTSSEPVSKPNSVTHKLNTPEVEDKPAADLVPMVAETKTSPLVLREKSPTPPDPEVTPKLTSVENRTPPPSDASDGTSEKREPIVAPETADSPATPAALAVAPSETTDELVPLRTMAANHKEKSDKTNKRNWGGRILHSVDDEKTNEGDDSPSDMSTEVSSQSLKDLVPNYKRLSDEEKEIQMDVMESDKVLDFEEASVQKSPSPMTESVDPTPLPVAPPKESEVEGAPAPKRPLIRSSVSPEKSTPANVQDHLPQSSVVFVANLVRPFTINQLKALLTRTGTFDSDKDFWIDKIKSKCYVRYAKHQEAKDTIAALNGVVWPSSNPKKLLVKLSSETQFNEVVQNGGPVGLTSTSKRHQEDKTSPMPNLNLARSQSEKRLLAEAVQDVNGGSQTVKPMEAKPLDELFKKTKHHPCIYWKTCDLSKA